MTRNDPWPAGHTETLKKLWPGHSASTIAERLGVTRSAVCGKALRLRRRGLLAGKGLSWAEMNRERRPTVDIAPVADPDPEPATTESGAPITMLNVTPDQCRWPIGDPATPEFHLCGRTKWRGASYCEHHARRAWSSSQKRGLG